MDVRVQGKRWTDTYIAGTGAALAPEILVEDAIASGAYDPAHAAKTQQLAATAAPAEYPAVDFAVEAASSALAKSGFHARDVDLLVYGVAYHAGHEVWNPASYIQRELDIPPRCLAFELRSGSNGLVGLELACSYLAGRPDARAALLLAADCCPPIIDRWHGLSGGVTGDGGSGLVVARTGIARVLATASTNAPELEGLHRGNEPFRPFTYHAGRPLDLIARSRPFLRDSMPTAEVIAAKRESLETVIRSCLELGGVDVPDVQHFALPFLGVGELTGDLLAPLGIPIERTTWEFGRRVGHLGAGDQYAGLHHLHSSGRVRPGDLTLLLGEGNGFTFTAALTQAVAPTDAN